jgi:hypothetical protein
VEQRTEEEIRARQLLLPGRGHLLEFDTSCSAAPDLATVFPLLTR